LIRDTHPVTCLAVDCRVGAGHCWPTPL
jgi:hypothetical protein